MSDTKVTGLTEATELSSTDLMYVVADPATTPASKKATITTVMRSLIPGLSGVADVRGFGGGGISEEYDTATIGLTWTLALDTVNSNTTIKSNLYAAKAFAAGESSIGTRAWTPGAGAFDARCHLAMATPGYVNWWVNGIDCDAALIISNADYSKCARVSVYFQPQMDSYLQTRVMAATYESAAWTVRGFSVGGGPPNMYLRIIRDAGDNLSFWYSCDGLIWQYLTTQALALTVALIGYWMGGNGKYLEISSDWLRTNK